MNTAKVALTVIVMGFAMSACGSTNSTPISTKTPMTVCAERGGIRQVAVGTTRNNYVVCEDGYGTSDVVIK